MIAKPARRFWHQTEVKSTEAGVAIMLDARPARTPAGADLVVPNPAMATAIAAEWHAQGPTIDPETMPFTRMANTALDRLPKQFARVADALAAYGETDLLCHRARTPQDLAAQQAAQWDPLLQWAAQALGARLQPTTGIMAAPQPPQALATLREQVHALTPFQLAAFHDLVALSGSLILGFAAVHQRHPAAALWRLSRLDEDWQQQHWGIDDEARATAASQAKAFLRAEQFFRMA
ncbi:MAG: ATPase [Rhodobacteraceae bacterium]|nr:ATPase [Paracoccaceae bacterium]